MQPAVIDQRPNGCVFGDELVHRRGNVGYAVVPPIVVKDELDSGELVEVAQLPELRETFYAMTLDRRFPNPLVHELLQTAPMGAPQSADTARR